MAIERTLVLIKPDGMKRRLAGPVIGKLEEANLILIGAKVVKVSIELAREHYAAHVDKPFFKELLDYITGKLHGAPYDRVLALVYEGDDAIKKIRALSGATNPEKAEPNTIRGMYGRITTGNLMENVLHASANSIEAEREIKLWFTPQEIVHQIYPTKKEGSNVVWQRIPTVAEIS